MNDKAWHDQAQEMVVGSSENVYFAGGCCLTSTTPILTDAINVNSMPLELGLGKRGSDGLTGPTAVN